MSSYCMLSPEIWLRWYRIRARIFGSSGTAFSYIPSRLATTSKTNYISILLVVASVA